MSYWVARRTASVVTAQSSALVLQLLTEMRRIFWPCHCEPEIQMEWSAINLAPTSRVLSSLSKAKETWVKTTSLSTRHHGILTSSAAKNCAFATIASTRVPTPSRPNERSAAQTVTPRPRRESSATFSLGHNCKSCSLGR